MDAIQLVGKTIVGHIPTDVDWAALQRQARRNLSLTGNPMISYGTTTAAVPWQTLQAYYTTTDTITSDSNLSPIGDISNTYADTTKAFTASSVSFQYIS